MTVQSTGQSASDHISDNLDQSGLFNDVTHHELQDINNTIDQLTPAERNVAVANLSDDELSTWSSEMDSNGILGTGGLTNTEKKDLFNDLAEGLDSTQLGRVYDSLSEDNQAMLADSVAQRASDDVKVDFVTDLAAGSTAPNHDFDTGFGYTSADLFNKDARNIATVLGSMGNNPQAFGNAIGNLSDDQLSAVLNAAVEPNMLTTAGGSGQPTYSFDTQAFTQVMEAVATSPDAAMKARVFHIGAEQIDNIRDTDSVLAPNPLADERAGEVANALTNVLNTDVVGIVTALESNDATMTSRFGDGMASYMTETIRQGDEAQISKVIAKLAAGNDLNADPKQYLSSFTEDNFGARNYQNASNLGYVVGAVEAGVHNIKADAQQQADLLNTIFGTGLSVAGKFGSTAFKVGTVLTDLGSSTLVDAVAQDIVSKHTSFAEGIERVAMPSELNSSDVENSFESAIARVIRNN